MTIISSAFVILIFLFSTSERICSLSFVQSAIQMKRLLGKSFKKTCSIEDPLSIDVSGSLYLGIDFLGENVGGTSIHKILVSVTMSFPSISSSELSSHASSSVELWSSDWLSESDCSL